VDLAKAAEEEVGVGTGATGRGRSGGERTQKGRDSISPCLRVSNSNEV